MEEQPPVTLIPFLDAATIAAHTPYPALIEALRAAFVDPPHCPRRTAIALGETATSAAGHLLVMPVARDGGLALVKLVTVHPALGARPGGALRSVALAIDAATGETISLIDGHCLTTRRTAATSVLAASALAHPDASHLAILGAGAVAGALAEAYASRFALADIVIWARRIDAAEGLAARLCAQGLPARAEADIAAAVAAADIVSTATLSTEPLIEPGMVRDGAHLDLIGGYSAVMREADPRLIASAAIVVDSAAALDAGDLAGPIADGLIDPAAIVTLTELLRGGRARPEGRRTVFKSVGLAIEDLAAAEMVVAGWRQARGMAA